MKRYKTTDKHPLFKKDLVVKINNDKIWIEEYSDEYPYDYHIGTAIENGWIEEIHEPEFTRDDMMKFAYAYSNRTFMTDHYVGITTFLDDWLKQRDKDKKN